LHTAQVFGSFVMESTIEQNEKALQRISAMAVISKRGLS